MKYRSLRLALASLLIGAFSVLAMPPWNIWPCMVIGISLFYWLLSHVATRRGALLYGWLFGFGYHLAGLWWIANALLVPGNPFKWVWPLTIAGLPALLAWFPAFGAWISIRRSLRMPAGYLAFVAVFGLSEWLRGHIFSGFPWNTYGYAWTGVLPMMQLAAFGGAFFLTLLTLGWAALPGFLWLWPAPRERKIAVGGVAVLLAGLCVAWGGMRLSANPTAYNDAVTVRPVQANISQADKWNPAKAGENLNRELNASLPEPGDHAATTVLIWPETALDQDAMSYPQVRDALRDLLHLYPGNVYLMTGMLRWDKDAGGKDRNYNSFVLFDKNLKMLSRYDKSHLVPFGEYVPMEDVLHMKPFVRFDGFTSGTGPVTVQAATLPAFTPLICYEVIFPGAITAPTGPRPQWLVNITNDAWYGDSPGPRQHFAQTRYRAIEEGLPVIRAAATGVSGVIDAYGRIVAVMPIGQAGAPSARLPRPAVSTPYSRYGDSFFFAAVLGLALASFAFTRRRPIP